jgi:pimeloyl-ACP methyl ester carboxylesterase
MWRVIRRIWITLGLGATAVFIAWSVIAYRANAEARAATRPNSHVSVDHGDGLWRFTPISARATSPALVFFPGALVDPRAYAPLAQAVASAGYPVILVELPRRGAFGGADAPELASRIRSVIPAGGPRPIVAGGHSRGAVVATRIAAENPARLAGLLIVGSSHPRDHDLSSLEIPVTKIVGTRDGLASPAEVRGNAALLPPHTRWLWIEGGNHSQFGWYGFQPMDRWPGIDASVQRAALIGGVLDLLAGVERGASSSGRFGP